MGPDVATPRGCAHLVASSLVLPFPPGRRRRCGERFRDRCFLSSTFALGGKKGPGNLQAVSQGRFMFPCVLMKWISLLCEDQQRAERSWGKVRERGQQPFLRGGLFTDRRARSGEGRLRSRDPGRMAQLCCQRCWADGWGDEPPGRSGRARDTVWLVRGHWLVGPGLILA